MKAKQIVIGASAVLAIIILSSFVAGRQANLRQFLERSPETRANLVTGFMERKLELSPAQTEKVYAINLKYAKLNQPYLEKGDDLTLTAELIDLNQKRREEILPLLNSEQKETATQARQKLIQNLELALNHLKTIE